MNKQDRIEKYLFLMRLDYSKMMKAYFRMRSYESKLKNMDLSEDQNKKFKEEQEYIEKKLIGWMDFDRHQKSKWHKISNFNNINIMMNTGSLLLNEPHIIAEFEGNKAIISIPNPVCNNENIMDHARKIIVFWVKKHQDKLMFAWENADYSWIEED